MGAGGGGDERQQLRAVQTLILRLAQRLQGAGLPQQAADAAPYVVTLLALALLQARRLRRSGTEDPATQADPSTPTPEPIS